MMVERLRLYGLSLVFLFFVCQVEAQVFIPFSYWGCNDVTPTFADDTSAKLTAGTLTNVSWNGSDLALTAGQSTGSYISRPLDKTTRCVNPPATLSDITKISWLPELPFGKELTATSESNANYTTLANSTLMANIAGVWHLNGSGAIASGTTIAAEVGSNGSTHNANGAGMTYTASGKLNSAITFDGVDDQIEIPYVQTGVSKYTIATWFKTASGGNNVFVQDRGSGAGLSLTLGIGNNPGGCAAGKISYGVDSNSIYIGKCTSSTYNDGNWHHAVGVWSGTSGSAVASAQFTIYIDGVAAGTTNTSVGAATAPLTGLGNTLFGRHDAWGVNLNGSMDEVAIWTRALTATEVQQLYRRGGNRLKFQVRSCASPTCAENPTWLGPDGSSSTFFTELNNNSSPSTGLGTPLTGLPVITFSDYPFLVLGNSEWFQYKIIFESDSNTLDPTVRSVTPSY